MLISSAQLISVLKTADFSKLSVIVVGFGNMGRQYVKALQALRVREVRVCSRSASPLQALRDVAGIRTFAGGYQQFSDRAKGEELVIVATPTVDLIPTTKHFIHLGYKQFLIEKPISLWSSVLHPFDETLRRTDVEIFCAYNRVAYPAVLEAKYLSQQEGGITSCHYTFTEFTSRLNLKQFTSEELGRWGVANSLHVISMAHALIGPPQSWKAYQAGSAVAWHPEGSVFVGAGISEDKIPFSYHADWGSTGRWSVEIHTKVSSYRFCPLEKLYRRTSAAGEWEEVSLTLFAPEVKMGFVEQIAAVLKKELRSSIPLVSLHKTIALTQFGEDVFSYEQQR